MSKEIALPDYLKDLLDDSSASLISATSSVPRLSLKGQKFRFIVDGEEVKRVNDELLVVIMGVEPERGMCKTFYREGYQPDSSDPPDCSSTDGVTPDAWVSNPVSSKCATCEMNAWGSAKSMAGGKAKACRDSKRLYITEAKELEDGTIYLLNVTVASLKALSQYGKLLAENRVPMSAAITKLVMDEDADHPKLDFEFVGILKEAKGKAALARAAKKEWAEYSVPALEGPKSDKPQLTHDEDEDEDEEETAAQKKARLAAAKEAKAKKEAAAKAKKEAEVDDDDDDEPVKKVKGELVDEKDSSPISDVDDLLDGWDD